MIGAGCCARQGGRSCCIECHAIGSLTLLLLDAILAILFIFDRPTLEKFTDVPGFYRSLMEYVATPEGMQNLIVTFVFIVAIKVISLALAGSSMWWAYHQA